MWQFQAHKIIHIRYVQSCDLPQKSKFKNTFKIFKFLEQLPRIGKKCIRNLEENVAPNAILCAFLKKLPEELTYSFL